MPYEIINTKKHFFFITRGTRNCYPFDTHRINPYSYTIAANHIGDVTRAKQADKLDLEGKLLTFPGKRFRT